jgi:hypothetical protein
MKEMVQRPFMGNQSGPQLIWGVLVLASGL